MSLLSNAVDAEPAAQRFDDIGVELLAALLVDVRECVVLAPGAAVGTVGRQCVEDVCDRDDAADERDVLAREPGRVSGSVPVLVMRPGNRRGELEQLVAGACEERVADLRVPFHLAPLGVRERVRLAQDRLADRDLADVVQRRREADPLGEDVLETDLDGDLARRGRDALDVLAGLDVVVLHRAPEPCDRLGVRPPELGLGGGEARVRTLELVGVRSVELPAPDGPGNVDEEVVRREGLRQVAVRPERERAVGGVRVVAAGDHDRRDRRRVVRARRGARGRTRPGRPMSQRTTE